VWRSIIAQLQTSLAFGQAVITSSRLPVWSTSSCDKKTQRTSVGSTRENTSFSHCSRLAGVPVSTIIGWAPRITIEFRYTNSGWPSAGCTWWITHVSGATRDGGTYVVGASGAKVMQSLPRRAGRGSSPTRPVKAIDRPTGRWPGISRAAPRARPVRGYEVLCQTEM
jgi:hypothetical protein